MKTLLRVDFNVPLDQQLKVTDDSRIRLSLPTIEELLERGDSVIIMSHLGRPKDREYYFSMRHLVPNLANLLNRDVKFAEECIGEETEKMASELKPGEVMVLENLRFYKEEEEGDYEFARKLSLLADRFVNDAFGVAHRQHASTYSITKYFTQYKELGFLMRREIQNLNNILENPERPLTAILGGSKVSDKVAVIENLLPKVDNLIIGGAMAYTFVKALGGKIGDSKVEDERLELARALTKKAEKLNVNFLLPPDSVVADSFSEESNTQVVDSFSISEGWLGLDIGPQSVEKFSEVISNSSSILWNGPMGVYEMSNFKKGTTDIAKSIARTTSNGAFSIVGGGDSIAALENVGLVKYISYVSSGGGAMLKYLEGNSLPSIKAIRENVFSNATTPNS